MSIFRLEGQVNAPVDSRYVSSLDITITNIGNRGFDILVHLLHQGELAYEMLNHVKEGYGTLSFTDLNTYNQPFSLLLVSNLNSFHTTGITVVAKQNQITVAIFSQEDFVRLL